MAQISKKLVKIFEEGKVKCEVVEHKTTYTAVDKAATNAKSRIKPQEVVKSLILKADGDFFLALLCSNRNLDMVKFKKTLNVQQQKQKKELFKEDPNAAKKLRAYKKVELAKEAWMKKNIPGKIGAVAPFSKLLGLQIFVDRPLLKQKQLYLGSGEYQFSIKITPNNYQKLEKGLVAGSFSKARKK